MRLLEKDSKIELFGGWNEYQVIRADSDFALLRCYLFVCNEDLGDGILCTRQNQEIWIAQFHAGNFSVASIAGDYNY